MSSTSYVVLGMVLWIAGICVIAWFLFKMFRKQNAHIAELEQYIQHSDLEKISAQAKHVSEIIELHKKYGLLEAEDDEPIGKHGIRSEPKNEHDSSLHNPDNCHVCWRENGRYDTDTSE
jgi:hypothetical protein